MTARIVDVQYHTLVEGLARAERPRQPSVDGRAQVGRGLRVLSPDRQHPHRARARRRAAATASTAPALAALQHRRAADRAARASAAPVPTPTRTRPSASPAACTTGSSTTASRTSWRAACTRSWPTCSATCRAIGEHVARTYFYYEVGDESRPPASRDGVRVRRAGVGELQRGPPATQDDEPSTASASACAPSPRRAHGVARLLRQLGAPLQHPAEASPPAGGGRSDRDDPGAGAVLEAERSPWRPRRPARRLLDAHYDFLCPRRTSQPGESRRSCAASRTRAVAAPSASSRAAVGLVHDNFRYEKGSTHVHSSIGDVLARGAGVCQDFAHLLIALARARGLPGALRLRLPGAAARARGGRSERRAVIGGQASHAWAEVLLPDVGWLGLDPTLGAPTRPPHPRRLRPRLWRRAAGARRLSRPRGTAPLRGRAACGPRWTTTAASTCARPPVPSPSGAEPRPPQQLPQQQQQ